ncbi:MAG: hypothetical protein RBS01_01430, partial [Candidatus Dojkabacteria bacterium]|nr:hypothetical protein [Candidatus Dojkabacteria bacterium]
MFGNIFLAYTLDIYPFPFLISFSISEGSIKKIFLPKKDSTYESTCSLLTLTNYESEYLNSLISQIPIKTVITNINNINNILKIFFK